MNSAILALDPGRHVGVAYFRRDSTCRFTTWRLACVDGGRLVELDRLLDGLHAIERIERVAYEEPFFSPQFPTAGGPLMELAGHIKFWAALRGIPYACYTPAEVKLTVCRKGNATKEQVLAAVRKLGYAVATQHEADAVALALRLRAGIPPAAPTRKAAAKTARRAAAATDLFRRLNKPKRRAG